MRGVGGRLRTRLTVAPIRPYADVPFERWGTGQNNVFPLPVLIADADSGQAASLLELATARSAELLRDRRVASLTTRGVLLLQQRLVYSLTRALVGLEKFEEQSAHVLPEAELEDEWVEALADDAGGETAMNNEAVEFATFMGGLATRCSIRSAAPTWRAACAWRFEGDRMRRDCPDQCPAAAVRAADLRCACGVVLCSRLSR